MQQLAARVVLTFESERNVPFAFWIGDRVRLNHIESHRMIQVHPNLQSVEQASALQRRLYRTIRETMRAMAGRISGVASWEAKKLLARHIWCPTSNSRS